MVKKNSIIIRAPKPAGLFYGVQTLRQLLPVEIERDASANAETTWNVPCVTIRDRPRYRWRGLHLDVARYFFDKAFVKKYLDYMAMHKLNKFHWHLTDNQGWRLQIDKYPKLTQIGAFREKSRINGIRHVIGQYDNIPHGGFYAKEDVKEIIAYAKSRFITVIPEIEMPGHCIAALAAYPEVSCTGRTFDVKKAYDTFNAGIPFRVAVDWRSYPDDFCAGKEVTFEFLENVLSEVIDLFPSEYIHIGGDECRKTHWKTCPDCQARMKAENLKNVEELQSYFIKRIAKFVALKGRKIIGWDEILEGGIAPEATVMSWRGTAGGIKAAKLGHDVIMTPTEYAYFDHYQGEPDFEPYRAIGGFLPLKKVYSFNPTPAGLTHTEARHILGGQANMWTDHFSTPEQIEYMVFPRISALAEAVWSPAQARDWDDFCARMEKQYQRYDFLGIHYSKSAFMAYPRGMANESKDTLLVSFDSQLNNAKVHYTLDSSEPGPKSPVFKKPIILKKSAVVKSGIFINGKLRGPVVTRKITLHKAAGKPVVFGSEPVRRYSIHENADLTNGMLGTNIFNDGLWLAFEGNDFHATVDLKKVMPVRSIAVNFLQFTGVRAFAPLWVEFAVSRDGTKYDVLGKIANDLPEEEHDPTIKTFKYVLDSVVKARYVRVIAKNRGVVPDWHPRYSGQKAWLFADEVIVN